MKHSVILLLLLQIFIVSSHPTGLGDAVGGKGKEKMGTVIKIKDTEASTATKAKTECKASTGTATTTKDTKISTVAKAKSECKEKTVTATKPKDTEISTVAKAKSECKEKTKMKDTGASTVTKAKTECKETTGAITKIKDTGISTVTKAKDEVKKLDKGLLEIIKKTVDDKYNEMKTLIKSIDKVTCSLKTKPKHFLDLIDVMKKEMEKNEKEMPVKIMGMMKSKIGDKYKKEEMQGFVTACSGMLNKMNKKDMALKLTSGATSMMTAFDNIKSVDVPEMKNEKDMIEYVKSNGFSETVETMTKMVSNLMADYATLQAMNTLNSVTAVA